MKRMTPTNVPKKLSRDQLIELCADQLEISAIYSNLYPQIKESTELEKLVEQCGSWGRMYETPMNEFVGKFFTLTNLDSGEFMKMMFKSNQKQRPIKARFDKLVSNLNPPEQTAWMLPLVAMALHGNARCLEKLAQSMDQLLAKGRAGDDKALLYAVRIDPAVIHAYSFQARLCRALLQNDKRFLQSLSKALMGKSPDLPSDKLDELRYLIGTLVEFGYFKMLSHEQWSEIFVDELAVYPKSGKDTHASCKKQIQLILKKFRK